MKIKSFLLGLTYAIILYVVLPRIFIFLNDRLSLPVIMFNYLRILGLVLIIFGAIFFTYLVGLFKYTGKGTPVPVEPPTKLIIKGPYKYVRNPMYLNHLLMFFAIFLVFGHFLLLLYLLLAWFGLNLLLVKWEEPQLRKRFGDSYANYMEKVPRWLPKIKI